MILSVGQTPPHTTAAQGSGARPQPLPQVGASGDELCQSEQRLDYR